MLSRPEDPAGDGSMLGKLVLKLAENPAALRMLVRLAEKTGLVHRFVAGESSAEAFAVVRGLNADAIKASLNLLGEEVTHPADAVRASQEYIALLDSICAQGLDCGISVKLTQLGLGIDDDECRRNLWPVLEKARQLGSFVRVDMEGSRYTERTVALVKESLLPFSRHLGIVLQAYLFRSEADASELSELACSIRLCKGAYREGPEVAFQKPDEIRRSFVRILKILLTAGSPTAIATHDPDLISKARSLIHECRTPEDRYEFQMLYGVRKDALRELRDAGYRTRVYVPFGPMWAPYFIRRIAERPANLLFALRAVMGS